MRKRMSPATGTVGWRKMTVSIVRTGLEEHDPHGEEGLEEDDLHGEDRLEEDGPHGEEGLEKDGPHGEAVLEEESPLMAYVWMSPSFSIHSKLAFQRWLDLGRVVLELRVCGY